MHKIILAAVLAVPIYATANTTVYSENFNSNTFKGASLDLAGTEATGDNWGVTNYYVINSAAGWNFSSGAFYAANSSGTDGALLLNENGGTALTSLTGLTQGNSYTLSFNVSGDNRPTQQYGLDVSVGGSSVLSFSGTDGSSGQHPGGILQTVNFVAKEATQQLLFSQNTPSGSAASPIIDNIQITTAVPEPESYALMLAGLGLMGAVARRRKYHNV